MGVPLGGLSQFLLIVDNPSMRCRRCDHDVEIDPEALHETLEHVFHILEDLMADQDTLNAAVTSLDDALTAIETEVAALKAAVPAPLDFTALDTAVARAQAVAPASAPVPAPGP